MSSVFTLTTEIKLNREDNQLFGEYISDYLSAFNKAQRIAFHRVKNFYIKHKKLSQQDKNLIHEELKKEFNLTTRALDAILSNMIGRFESIKELKNHELKVLERKISVLEEDLEELKDERTLKRIELKENPKEFNFVKYKNLKTKIYWKHNNLNKKKQKLINLQQEIDSGRYKVCFGTKRLLQKDYKEYIKKRDSELFFIGRKGDNCCNNNFQVEHNNRTNKFYFKLRREINIDEGKYVYGSFIINNKNYTKLLKRLLKTKESPLSYRIKVKNNKVYLQIIYNFEHNKKLCLTRDTYGVIGVDFNKGFVAVSETNEHGNLVNTFNIDYRFGKGNQTTEDFQKIAKQLTELCLEKGKDLVIEKLNFTKTKSTIISKKGKKYNEMLSSIAYSKFNNIIVSKCTKTRVFLKQVNPAWTSWTAKQKYCSFKNLNIHSGAAYVIARRGMNFKDKVKKKKTKK